MATKLGFGALVSPPSLSRWSLPVPGLDTPEASVPHAPLPCFLVLVRPGLAFSPFSGCSLVVLSAGIGVPEDVSVSFEFPIQIPGVTALNAV